MISSFIVFGSALGQSKNKSYKEQWQFPPKDSSFIVTAEQQRELYATEEEMQWFKDAKFGIFVHWGPALLETNVLSWGRYGERPGAGRPAKNGVPKEVYDNLYKKFNPVNFDADRWMKQVKSWGAEYIIFTAKHHDGFCFFDAKNTDYDIMSTPYGRDIARQLADAAHENNVKLFWYYSQPDWTHPDNLREKHYENYLPYMKEHLETLFTDYGKIDGIFWDHLATKYWQWDSYHIYKKMKEWQPGIISNARNGFGWPLRDRGDYDTPEQSLGPIDHHRYWEACLTMTDKWLYSPKGPIKTFESVLGMLVQVAGNGGNLLLNLGPDGKGEFVEEEVEEVQKIGEWIEKYGYTLKNTRRGIYMGGDYGATTQQEETLYLHFLEQLSDDAEAVFELPELPMKIKAVDGVTEGFKNYEVENGHLKLIFDKSDYQNNLDNIIKLELAKDPAEFERIETWKAIPVAASEFEVSASSSARDNPEVLYQTDGNVFSEGIHLKKWWSPAKNDKNPTLTLEFNQPKEIKTVLLSEHIRTHSVRDFDIEIKDQSGDWKRIFKGGVIGEGLRIKLSGNDIYGIRLVVNKSQYRTEITAFNIYE